MASLSFLALPIPLSGVTIIPLMWLTRGYQFPRLRGGSYFWMIGRDPSNPVTSPVAR